MGTTKNPIQVDFTPYQKFAILCLKRLTCFTKGLCQRKIGWVQHFLKLTFFKIYGLF